MKINTYSPALNIALVGLTTVVGLCTMEAVSMRLEPLRRQGNLAQRMGLSIISYTAAMVVTDRLVSYTFDMFDGYNVLVDVLNARRQTS